MRLAVIALLAWWGSCSHSRASKVRLVGVPGSSDGVAIRVENPGKTTVKLRRALRLEREDGGTWAKVDVSDIWLRTDCEPQDGVIFWRGGADECVDVAAGGTYEASGWFGTIGDAQCACEECGGAPAGRYRFVATLCDGGTLEGEPFDFKAP